MVHGVDKDAELHCLKFGYLVEDTSQQNSIKNLLGFVLFMHDFVWEFKTVPIC